MEEKYKKLTDELVKRKLTTPDEIEKALLEAKKTGLEFDRVLVNTKAVDENQLASVKADIIGKPFIALKEYLIDPSVVELVPEDVARKLKIMPLFKIEDTLTVAVSDPEDIYVVDELSRKTPFKTIDTVMSSEGDIAYAIDHYYGVSGDVEEVVKDTKDIITEVSEEDVAVKVLEQMAEEAPVVKVVNLILLRAIKMRASDIHLEPTESQLDVRFRIDGVMRSINPLPKHLKGAIISRIKILSRMDIAEKRKPQDGRIKAKVENKDIDIRVSTYPTVNGENVVMRILDKSSFFLGLTQLGFSKSELARFQNLIKRPYGIMLVTGPTGSGKTTTLYAALNEINSIDKNVITIEDPVEYQLPLIRQSQINPKAGLTFATGLRSILRQDPDIIMVGEVRDLETAEIAIQAALTGHLVFSTLHTNDAPSALTRLEDMGIEPFLVSSTVVGILAQRLVRVLCNKCKESYEPSDELLHDLNVPKQKNLTFHRPKGCNYCEDVGYKGRTGIFELLEVTDEIKDMILKRTSSHEIRETAVSQGMHPLWTDGLQKAKDGITTIEEVVKVTKE